MKKPTLHNSATLVHKNNRHSRHTRLNTMKKIALLASVSLFFAFTNQATAQVDGGTNVVKLPSGDKQVTNTTIIPQTQYWLRYYNKLQINDKFMLHTELEDRRYFKPNRAYQTMLPRIHLHYFMGSGWEVLAGFAYFTNTQPTNTPHQASTVNVPELRPMVGFEYKQINKRFEINHRYWMEERFQHNYNSTSLELSKGYQFSLRGRYRFQLQYALIRKETAKGTLRFNFSEEIFINIYKGAIINTFDQNRIFLGLNYGLTRNLILEAGWYKIYQASATTVGTYYNRDVIRVTLTHNMSLKKTIKKAAEKE